MAEEWKEYIVILLMSISITFVLQDIVSAFSISSFYAQYLIVLPIIILLILKVCIHSENKKIVLSKISYIVLLSIVEYLGLILFHNLEASTEIKLSVYIATAICLLLCNRNQAGTSDTDLKDEDKDREKTIFSLYYINTNKVYEIAMLLNNKVITGGVNENETNSSLEKQTNFGISTNLSYLETIKGDLGISQGIQTHNGIKNKVSENFEIKTTKSNMLASIITRAKDYASDAKVGDLVLLKNASLRLLNAEESYAITRMILNGAFKDTKISSNSDDMKIEMDLSAMINSLLKDCVYELKCVVSGKEFLLTIPMTFENDFENSYNIYDLQIGKVTVVGIYKGQCQCEKRLSLQEIFSENKEANKKNVFEETEYELKPSSERQNVTDHNIEINDINSISQSRYVVDVIAIIQEVNAK